MRRLLLALLCLLPALAFAASNPAITPLSRMNLPWWRAHFADMLSEAKADPDAQVIWLGDSITQYWQRQGANGYDNIMPVWQHYYGAPYHALAFGCIGDTTASLIWRLDHGQVAGLHPRLAIILIGANNIGRVHWAAPLTVPGIEAVVANTRARLPQTHILLLGILPSIRSAWIDQQTVLINAALARRYAGDPTVTFIDAGGVLRRNGRADPTLFVDPRLTPPDPAIHPDAEGMARVAAFIQPEVTRYAQ
jgi:lysophospholipase L1-like esterase